MTFTIRLERANGTPAEPPTIRSAVTDWRTGDTIPIAAGCSLRVVGIVATNEDEPPVLRRGRGLKSIYRRGLSFRRSSSSSNSRLAQSVHRTTTSSGSPSSATVR
jgi:hypothetical protein